MATADIQNLALDNEGDLIVVQDSHGNKSFKLITGQNAIQQNLQARILTLLNERVLHPGYGFNFAGVETVFDENLVRGEMARTILDDPDVKEITDFKILFDGRIRQASYEGTIRLQDDSVIGISGTT